MRWAKFLDTMWQRTSHLLSLDKAESLQDHQNVCDFLRLQMGHAAKKHENVLYHRYEIT